uniref:Precorrin-6y C5,15-methyltransferase subunit (CbiT) n=2 Tax=environmental samples TaxID=651140 RepID=A0A075I621_9ARCH|nr:precorrin-6y C5,15-methyltransferase subunit (cbiT) [uncultured marine thaumarchaeote SAT1000_04_B06]
MCLDKLKLGGRIVIGMIQIETIFSVLSFVEEQGLESVDITQITISKSRKTSTGTMMLARNPVTVLSASKN